MNIEINLTESLESPCLILGLFEDNPLTGLSAKIDKAMHGLISQLIKECNFQGKMGQVLPIFHPANTAVQCLVLVGCGKNKPLTPPQFRKLLVQSFKILNGLKTETATCFFTDLPVKDQKMDWKIKQITEAAQEGTYRFDLFKTEKDAKFVLKELSIYMPDKTKLKTAKQAIQEGLAVAKGVELAKNLGNTPSNICTPSFLAEQAKELAKSYSSLSIKILDEKDMQKLGMGAILGVSQGSAEEAKLICLEYKGSKSKQKPIALVGKGITFDTGGNSLKPPDAMVGMKYDMCGAASVLGTIKAIAELKLPIHVIGVIPAVENMPGGTAYKPEDILTSLSGQTIEVISTDAEGRLILADALTFCEQFKPDVVIDIATLTGAVVIALGFHATGLLSNHAPLAKELLEAGEVAQDRAWELPLWDEYQEQIKSPFADMANTGGRPAGTITAGCFLSRFAKSFHWAHLDVAGTAAMMLGTAERHATGRPVPLLVQFLLNRLSK